VFSLSARLLNGVTLKTTKKIVQQKKNEKIFNKYAVLYVLTKLIGTYIVQNFGFITWDTIYTIVHHFFFIKH